MIKETRITIEGVNTLEDETKVRFRYLANALVLFAASSEYKSFLISRGFDYYKELDSLFDLGFKDNLSWLRSNNVINQHSLTKLSIFQDKVEELFSSAADFEQIGKELEEKKIEDSASGLLELLSVPKDEFNFDGRYVLIAESDTEKTSKEKIKSYISAYIQCFILITLIASLSHFSGKNEYNNPYYITLIVSFVGALILLSTGFLIFEIAMPKRTKLNNRKLERILNGFQFLDNIKDIPETYYRNYLCNIEWNITDQFNMYRSALIFTVKFKENDLPHDKIKLSNKRMSMGSDYIQYDLACGYYKLPDEDKIIKCLDEMIDLLSENCLHPISKEESDIMQAMAAIQQNEYDYREEHFYQ